MFFVWSILLVIFAINVFETLRVKKLCVVDNVWTLGFVLQAVLFYFTKSDGNTSSLVGSLLIVVANTRLFLHLRRRNYGLKGDDPRFDALREKMKVEDTFMSIFTKIYLPQYVLAVLIGFTIYFLNSGKYSNPVLFILGTVVWVIGFYLESTADRELREHIAAGKTTVLDTGVWALCRHPNYFGEFTMWLGVAIIAFGNSHTTTAFLAPAVIYYILNYVSGVPMSEKRWDESKKPGWAEYKARTPKFFPFSKFY